MPPPSKALSQELRHLAPIHVEHLGSIFNVQNEWKKFMAHIPMKHNTDGSDRDKKRFTLDDIK